MIETARKALLEKCKGHVTLEGHRAIVAGWKIPYFATVNAEFAGSYQVEWAVLERVVKLDDGKLMAEHLSEASFKGLWGEHMATVPAPIRRKFGMYFERNLTLPIPKKVAKRDSDRAKLAKWVEASRGRT